MPDIEKVSFNMSVVDLGQVDLLVEQGFYSSRTDFLVAAVRNLLQNHSPTVRQAVEHRAMILGVAVYGKSELERRAAEGNPLDIRVVGVLKIDDDVTPELARAAIRSVTVFGKFRARPEVISALMFRKEKPERAAQTNREQRPAREPNGPKREVPGGGSEIDPRDL
jgi:Arc/MetJ-type ribon-helix-helix transcriptional regulator